MSPLRSHECTVKKNGWNRVCGGLWFGYSKQSREDNCKRVNFPYRPYETIFRSIAASEFSGGFQAFSSAAIIATQGAWYIISRRTERHVLNSLEGITLKIKPILRMNSVTFSPEPIKYIILLFICDLKATNNIYSFYKSYKISSNSSESSL